MIAGQCKGKAAWRGQERNSEANAALRMRALKSEILAQDFSRSTAQTVNSPKITKGMPRLV